jgi:H/ACA ribonucleoprotein complex non-core subunit NAF1
MPKKIGAGGHIRKGDLLSLLFLSFVMNFQFRAPETIPQDILLIRDIVGYIPPANPNFQKDVRDSIDSSDDSIASSSNEIDSEDEVEADLLVPDEESSTSIPAM